MHNRCSSSVPCSERVAVLAHVFYPQFWPDLRNCIRNFLSVCGEERVRVVLTLPETMQGSVRDSLSSDFPEATILPVPNRGYDVGPFFHALNHIDLDDFDYVVKIHTKRDLECCYVNFRPLYGSAFRKACLEFCSTRRSVERLMQAFKSQPDVGMIASRRMIDPSGYGSCRNPWKNAAVLQDVGITPRGYAMVLGTMFAIRASLLKPTWRRYSFDDFTAVTDATAHHEYGKAIVWEGAFGMLVLAEGYRISDGRSSAWLEKLGFAFRGFIYRLIRRCMALARVFVSDKVVDAIVRWR